MIKRFTLLNFIPCSSICYTKFNSNNFHSDIESTQETLLTVPTYFLKSTRFSTLRSFYLNSIHNPFNELTIIHFF